MATFLAKVRALTLGTAHDLLDRTIDLNSPSIVRQYVRDLEDATFKLNSEFAVQDGQLRTLERERGDVASSIDAGRAIITKLLASSDPNAPAIAKKRGTDVLENQKRLTLIDNNISTQKQTVASLKQAVDSLQSKHQEMVERVRDLERLDRDSKAKQAAANALNAAGKIAGTADTVSVDDIAERMHRTNDVANAQFDQAMGNFHVSDTSGVDQGDVDALLAELAPKSEPVTA